MTEGLASVGYISGMDVLQTCAFCEIVAGARAADFVYVGDDVVAFLDARPLFPGHVLVAPRRHVATLSDLPDDSVLPLMSVVRAASRAMTTALHAQGSFVAINNLVSQSVPHLHVHVVPRSKGDGLRGFFWPRVPYVDDEQRMQIASSLTAAIAADLGVDR